MSGVAHVCEWQSFMPLPLMVHVPPTGWHTLMVVIVPLPSSSSPHAQPVGQSALVRHTLVHTPSNGDTDFRSQKLLMQLELELQVAPAGMQMRPFTPTEGEQVKLPFVGHARVDSHGVAHTPLLPPTQMPATQFAAEPLHDLPESEGAQSFVPPTKRHAQPDMHADSLLHGMVHTPCAEPVRPRHSVL